ncbi:hypothetical protein PLESTF_000784900 [Pleodorina starrii]|nr:hypothetical protein PLESTM_001903600 [Pleodorina starrii]GLC69082.1 hypothetical protein PLESTF_000784900 [Pleodorina starrii]
MVGQPPPLFQSPNGGRPAFTVDIPGFIQDGSSAAVHQPSTARPRRVDNNNPQQQQRNAAAITNATANFAIELVKPGKSCTNGSSRQGSRWPNNAVNAPRPRRIAWVETSSSSVSGGSPNKLLEEPLPALRTGVRPAAWVNDDDLPDVEQSQQQQRTTQTKAAAGALAVRRIAWPGLLDVQPQCTPTQAAAAAAVLSPQQHHPDIQQQLPQAGISLGKADGAAHPPEPPRRPPNVESQPTTSSTQLQAASDGAVHPGWLARLHHRKARPAGGLSKSASSLATAHGSECADAAVDKDLDDPLTFILGSSRRSREDSLTQPLRPRPVWPSLVKNGASSAAARPFPVRTEEDEDSDRYDAMTEAMLAACDALMAAAAC